MLVPLVLAVSVSPTCVPTITTVKLAKFAESMSVIVAVGSVANTAAPPEDVAVKSVSAAAPLRSIRGATKPTP